VGIYGIFVRFFLIEIEQLCKDGFEEGVGLCFVVGLCRVWDAIW